MSGNPTLSGVNIKHAELHVPSTGLWHLDVALQDAPDPGTTPRSFVFQGLTMACAALRNINFAGERGLRLIAGAGGWRKTIGPRQYAGKQVMLSTVVNDAALEVGELTPTIAVDQSFTAYVRAQGPAIRVLDYLPGWWADFTGRVQTAARSTTPITSEFVVLDVDRAAGKYVIATDTLADWTPGRTFATAAIAGTVVRVYHEFTAQQVRTHVFGPVLTAGAVVT
jgi:hypothetical protein